MKKSDLKDTEVKYVSETDIKRKNFFQRTTSKFNIKIDKWFVKAEFQKNSKFSFLGLNCHFFGEIPGF